MLRNFRRLLCLFVDISITPLTRRNVECKFSARVRDPSRALRDFMSLSGHFPLESLTVSAFFQSHQKQVKIGYWISWIFLVCEQALIYMASPMASFASRMRTREPAASLPPFACCSRATPRNSL